MDSKIELPHEVTEREAALLLGVLARLKEHGFGRLTAMLRAAFVVL